MEGASTALGIVLGAPAAQKPIAISARRASLQSVGWQAIALQRYSERSVKLRLKFNLLSHNFIAQQIS